MKNVIEIKRAIVVLQQRVLELESALEEIRKQSETAKVKPNGEKRSYRRRTAGAD